MVGGREFCMYTFQLVPILIHCTILMRHSSNRYLQSLKTPRIQILHLCPNVGNIPPDPSTSWSQRMTYNLQRRRWGTSTLNEDHNTAVYQAVTFSSTPASLINPRTNSISTTADYHSQSYSPTSYNALAQIHLQLERIIYGCKNQKKLLLAAMAKILVSNVLLTISSDDVGATKATVVEAYHSTIFCWLQSLW